MSDPAFHERLQNIDLGNGVAEHDNLLSTCIIETQHFTDLIYDRIDLVLGSKGAGKSSLFRIFGEMLEARLLKNWKVIVVSGVETQGEPIFKTYAENFHKFTESQFESFWKAYFLGLVYNKIFHDEKIYSLFKPHEIELFEFKKQYENLGLLDAGEITSTTKLLKLICAFTIAAIESVQAGWDVEKNQFIFGVNLREKLTSGFKEVTVPDISNIDTVLCIDALSALAEKSEYKIWILLDHLDVVFKRRSPEEARALRALLKVLYAITSKHVRLKIFLRDDILDAISSDTREPLAALSHITARAGPILRWTSDSLCILIMKRLATDYWLTTTYSIDSTRLSDVDYARECFKKIFNIKYIKQECFDWIYTLLSDGRGVVTPRDLIDLLKKSLHLQSLWLQKHPEKSDFMSIPVIQQAHAELSKNRKETVLQTEFSHLMHWIRKLENNKETYSKEELQAVYGSDADQAIPALEAIGIIQFNSKKACYRVAKLYGTGLQVYVTRSKSRKSNGK